MRTSRTHTHFTLLWSGWLWHVKPRGPKDTPTDRLAGRRREQRIRLQFSRQQSGRLAERLLGKYLLSIMTEQCGNQQTSQEDARKCSRGAAKHEERDSQWVCGCKNKNISRVQKAGSVTQIFVLAVLVALVKVIAVLMSFWIAEQSLRLLTD